MRIPFHIKDPCPVKPIPVGKNQVVESIWEPTKSSVKVKYLWWEKLLSKYSREVTGSYLIEPQKAPNHYHGKFIYSILLKYFWANIK